MSEGTSGADRGRMMPDGWHEFADGRAMAVACAKSVADAIDRALQSHGDALLAFPGGSTPVEAFEILAEEPVDWERVTILPGDDRLVGWDDPLSNFAQLRGFFAKTGANLLPLFDGETEQVQAARQANEALARFDRPLDLVWLGVGGDGHTASIFPGPDYAEALATTETTLVVRPDPLPPEAPVARITLSPAAIRSAGHRMISLRGPAKREVLLKALADGDRSEFPVGRVMNDTDADFYWSP
ncbi:6-phosphogluconolactonase [Qipengyuania sp. JC766]|uniref:6-phosphogluconolactonase n=1 Tax=Qipengyuania sp. JC766 TaxID=3232139 RepID=UPI00345909A7